MATTPEGAIKKEIRRVLDDYKSMRGLHYFMPVQGGFGPALLDFYGCHMGRFFAIEAKRPGGKPTDRQTQIIRSIQLGGGRVFVIDNILELRPLMAWLNGLID